MSIALLVLPDSVDHLRVAIRAAIASYQEAPVDDETKLNQALAASLGLSSYDELLTRAYQEDANGTPVTPYPLSFDYNGDQQMIINGTRIDTELTHNGALAYTVVEREKRIKDLRRWIAEGNELKRRYSLETMKNNLTKLLHSKADYVLEELNSIAFITPDLEPALFNKTCDEVLADAAKHYQGVVGVLTKTGTLYTDAHTHYGGDNLPYLYANELVLISEAYLSDDKLPIGMSALRFEGVVHDGYIAAYACSSGEYVPVHLGQEEE